MSVFFQRRKGGWPKGKKRKYPESSKDSNAPKAPLNGYVRFLQDSREKVRKEYPDIPYSEVTRILGTRWSQLPADPKQRYLDEAQRDKERYLKELGEYQQTDAYKSYLKKNKGQEDSSVVICACAETKQLDKQKIYFLI